MQINKILKNITTTDLSLDIKGLALNSNEIKQGYAFIAIAGIKTHGNNFIINAIENCALVIFSDKKINVHVHVPVIIIKDLKNKLDILASNIYPQAKNHKIIAITGTNGKTSVASFLTEALKGLGILSQMIGTLTNTLTTPDIFTLYQKLNNFNGEYSIVEVSSHALIQGRTKGLVFEMVIWTNLSQDHLDYHLNMDNYLQAKLLITSQAKFGIFNKDDKSYSYFADKLPHNTYSLQEVTYNVKEFGFLCNIDNIIFEINLIGVFNLYNVLATYKALLKLGFDKLAILQNIANLTNPPGRMQKIMNSNIWVDFAHTPDGLKNALTTLKEHYPANNITVVFGCGGNRDKNKRAKMGKVANDLADRIILTNDNPRDENPQQIIDDILLGILKKSQVITDRALAIEAGISKIDDGDNKSKTNKINKDECVLIAGKGVENYQIIADEKVPFNDVVVVTDLL